MIRQAIVIRPIPGLLALVLTLTLAPLFVQSKLAAADFEVISARVEIAIGNVRIDGSFNPDAAPNGLDVLNEAVKVSFGGLSATLPAGSFIAGSDPGHFRLKGTTPGLRRIDIDVVLGLFQVIARNVDLSSIDFTVPVEFSLRIGDDIGATTILFDEQGRFPGD